MNPLGHQPPPKKPPHPPSCGDYFCFDCYPYGEAKAEKGGYLVMRVKPGQGCDIEGGIEVRLSDNRNGHTRIAIRAPKHLKITPVR